MVVVSNRVPQPGQPGSGGLMVALQAALEETGGVWFGWSGQVGAGDCGVLHEHRLEVAGGRHIDYLTVDLSQQDHDEYYNGFANRALWPLLHFRLDLVDYDRGSYRGYRRVNERFARTLAPRLRDDDIVWIHDYHLIPLARLLRQAGVRCKLGFFLHVPMPSSDLLAGLPHHEELFEGLSSHDLVGFQTVRDLERFQDYVRLFGRGRVIDTGLLETASGHRLKAGAFPISIDTAHISQLAEASVDRGSSRRLSESLGHRQLAIGVDRLDYSKGLPERFRAFERYLQEYPDQRDRLTFLQIAPVSRGGVPEYQELRAELEQLAGHVNGSWADADWTPMRYVNRNYPHATLTGFYRQARVGLVTPLRDGMNLVAKEYVAAQDPEDPGVLVLSLFAGAAREMDGALLVNPYDLDGVAAAIARAAAMPLEERRQRWQPMMARLRDYDITRWRNEFLDALRAA
nr:alpha,alpha-trehalose-phosphate synthase (UDP-forming) [Lysobacter sp. GX 14042]